MSVARVNYVPQEQRKGISHHIPRGLRREIVERDGGRCQVCGKKGTHVSHRIPVCRGGETLDWNLALCCEKCSKAKDDLVPEEFLNTHYIRELMAPDLLGDHPLDVIVALVDGSYIKGQMREHPITRSGGGDWTVVVQGIELFIPRERVRALAILPRNKRIKVDIAGYLKRISS